MQQALLSYLASINCLENEDKENTNKPKEKQKGKQVAISPGKKVLWPKWW